MSPRIAAMLPISTHSFMMLAGVVEVIAGLLVAFKPRIGAYVVGLWLLAIIANLLMVPATSTSHCATSASPWAPSRWRA